MELLSLEPLGWLLALVAIAVGLRYSLVDQPAWRKGLAFACRAGGITALILGICRPYLLTPSDRLHVVFLVDVSDSVDLDSITDAAATVAQSIEGLRSTDTWTLHAVGAETRRLDTPKQLTDLANQWQSDSGDTTLRRQSRLADAMLTARLDFPAGATRRLVLLSDGRGTGEPDALTAALKLLDEERVDVRFQPIDPLAAAEAAVVSLQPATPSAFQGEVLRLRATVQANRDMAARLRIVHRGVAEQEKPLKLFADQPQVIEFDIEARSAGPARYTAELVPAEDRFPLNNTLACTVDVRGEPRVLALHTEPRDLRPFARALKEQGVELDVRGRLGLPGEMEELLEFDAVMLADLPATDLSPRQMAMLKRYVTDFGGGLVMTGSENSFGLGGYFKTPVEEVLPLVSRFEKEKEKPSLAMMLVIDKSGSMGGAPIALARQAAKAAVELLSLRDLIGVIGFDGAPRLVCELRSAADRDAIQASIDALAAGGGTNMFPAMVQARDMLEQAPAKIRHMIVLSDGRTQPADHMGLTQEAVDAGITVSTVALGGADKELLSAIAEVGRGRYYETNDPSNVPQIFTKETMQASKSAIKEDLFGAVQTGDHPMLSGFSDAELPFSLGYVMTEAKPTAQQLLAAETGDPLLAVGRYGLGTGLAYTSDLTERWGGDWLAWEGCGRFWAQVLRGVLRKQDTEGLSIAGRVVDETWRIDLLRRDASRRPVTGVTWDAATTDGQGRKAKVEVTQVGLGRYQAAVPLTGADRVSLRVLDSDFDKLKVVHWQRPYPKEYTLASQPTPELAGLPGFAADAVRDELTPEPRRKPISSWVYLTGIGLLIAGVVLRRV
ncbi:MAG: VWA domain-containing protein [Planctomycetota bacterium]